MNADFHMIEGAYTVSVTDISVSKYYPATYWEPAEGGELEYDILAVTFTDAEGHTFQLSAEQLEWWCFHYEERLIQLIWNFIEEQKHEDEI